MSAHSPPSLPLGSYLAVRINVDDTTKLTPRDVSAFFKAYLSPFITVAENADEEVRRDHTHSLLKTTDSINTFRKQLKKKFPNINGNTDYSIQQVKTPYDSLKYMCKGLSQSQLPIIIETSLGAPLVAQAHHDYWERRKEITQTNAITKNRPKALTWTDRTLEELRQHYGGIEVLNRDTVIALTDDVLKKLGKTAKKFSQRTLSELVLGFGNALLLEFNPKNHSTWSRRVGETIWDDTSFLGYSR